MRISIKKMLFYTAFVLIIVFHHFVSSNGLISGELPDIQQNIIDGASVMEYLGSSKGPVMIYFWAEWCGICNMMRTPVTAVLKDYSGITVTVKSGETESIQQYLKSNGLNWKVANDPFGKLGEHFRIKGVPTVFFINENREIKFTSVGYTSEIGLRIRLWMVNNFNG